MAIVGVTITVGVALLGSGRGIGPNVVTDLNYGRGGTSAQTQYDLNRGDETGLFG